jgi:hypothetical protein
LISGYIVITYRATESLEVALRPRVQAAPLDEDTADKTTTAIVAADRVVESNA